ncbi:type I toxin-antitoxin system Fst family toxin [Lactobacillus sp. LC28-10]|uniref:Type I toxin-antitoxin system Fst family toxin n=1 Tax=Secundilactobacillus angelensis TaxID=2722706 RepID=A0ABX1KVW2_9LACO|nr:type I toxin-antitoxin system Fst family toxin [Secundilactobacillus angelensis]MCH5461324.1 type I toxin-antitoxin system Fst family toxin [Secundilactobacillus angelensis]NLR17480.1 type I toxin-antitoxin system Fst family toxin [Secundilactobacillus angelensis]
MTAFILTILASVISGILVALFANWLGRKH